MYNHNLHVLVYSTNFNTNLSAGIFPMRLLTGPGSATVMVVFRDYDGNTAASGGVVTYDMGGGIL